jgi:hypothetical protein
MPGEASRSSSRWTAASTTHAAASSLFPIDSSSSRKQIYIKASRLVVSIYKHTQSPSDSSSTGVCPISTVGGGGGGWVPIFVSFLSSTIHRCSGGISKIDIHILLDSTSVAQGHVCVRGLDMLDIVVLVLGPARG